MGLRIALLLVLCVPAAATQTSVQRQRIVTTSSGSIAILDGALVPLEAGPGQAAGVVLGPDGLPVEGADSPRLQRLSTLEFDRRPSAELAAWASPREPEPTPESVAAEREAKAAQAPAAAVPSQTPPASEPQPVSTLDPAPPSGLSAPIALTPATPSSAASASGGSFTPAATIAAAEPGAPPDEVAPAVDPAEAARAAAEQAARQGFEAAHLEWELAGFQRDVTLGDWPAVETYLAGLTEEEQKAGYSRLLSALQAGPSQRPAVPQQGRAYLEVNRFAPADVIGLAQAAPLELEKEHLASLGAILAQALKAGHQIEGFLAAVRPGLEAEQAALDRRRLARVLVAAGQPLFLGEFLPTVDEAEAADDREGLNLLSRYLLAQYEKEKKVTWLEQAWAVTQAVLAAGEVDEDEKAEALARAVDIAPKIRADLGQAWLDESFTSRPERGLEIVAAIGATASTALQSKPLDSDARFKLLELQTTAVEALLAAAPELASEWSDQLELLAGSWLREAEFTYLHDDSASRGPSMQRDPFGNFFYYNSRSRQRGNMPQPLRTDKVLEIRPSDDWLARIDATLRPRLQMVFAQLLLKVSEEAEAFPYIELVARTHPRQAKDLVDEFLRVWAKNHNPNESQDRANQYVFFFGFEQRAAGIPLTRSKQERNLAELAEWVARLRALPVELDDELIAQAFTTAHSSAEVYRLETIERIFGSLGELEPSTLAELVQKMRTNLVGVWRDPALQKDNKTNRRKKDIEAEVLRGYELAHTTLAGALEDHPDSWELLLAQAAIDHDENTFRAELGKDPQFGARRAAAFEIFARAAELYAFGIEDLEQDEETTRVYELWFYAALGACDLNAVKPEMQLDARQIDLITDAILELSSERSERHTAMFASQLFTRMSNANPGVKFRYVREGLAIVGDHEMAREARKVLEYYQDLVTEIELVARIDGNDRVGHEHPFGLHVDIRHTREIERESGGFSKYLVNQNVQNFGFNYGRPTEDYRDKFEEAAREALGEHFEVLTVTFNSPEARSRADGDYGWRVTPYAYLLLEARGPQVDRIPPLRLDLDFLDTTGYAVLPIESPVVPIDAALPAGDARPYQNLALTQILDERQAGEGRLILEVQAKAVGLVPELDTILDLAPEGFELVTTEDQGVAVVQFDEELDAIDSERTWSVTMRAREDLERIPRTFTFGAPLVEGVESEQFRYEDADLASVGLSIALDAVYGETSNPWLWRIPVALALLIAGAFGLRAMARPRVVSEEGPRIPEPLTPFTVLGLLRDIQANNGLDAARKGELASEIEALEYHFFVGDEPGATPDLRGIAETWAGRAS